jgi:Eukaryotic protein of unknown function (DUF829)
MLSLVRSRVDAGFELHARLSVAPSLSRPPSNVQLAPLVVVIGFLGAKPSVVRRIALTYEHLGYDTAWTIPPTSTTFALTNEPQRAFSSALVAALADLGHGGVILAPFSNSGCYVIRSLHCALVEPATGDALSRALYERVVGIVYDSCPCVIRGLVPGLTLGAQALAEGQPPSLGLVPWSLVYSALLMASNFVRTAGSVDGNFMRDLDFCVFPSAGELFCFSESDPLCSAEGVDKFIDSRRERVSICLRQVFTDSSHVAHLRTYPEVYLGRLRELHGLAINPWRRSMGLREWRLADRKASL